VNSLKGKTAIITGASSGIGKAIAKNLAKHEVNVVLAARSEEKLQKLAKEINENNAGKALAVKTDVMDQSQISSLVAEARDVFGTIDLYVNNAGVMLESTVQGGNVSDWELMIDVNIKGVLYGINEVVGEMVERGSGHIFNISSVSGKEVTKMSTVYSATKFAVRAISEGMEKELARTGVRVTNISPGMVDTDLASWRGMNKKAERKILRADDIAEAIIYAATQPEHVNINELTIRPV